MTKKNVGKVMTVLGPIEPSELGNTITHEHLFFDLSGYRSQNQTPERIKFYEEPLSLKNLNKIRKDAYSNRDNCIHMDRDVTLREMAAFRAVGGKTICDVSPGGVKEGVMETLAPMLKEMATASGLNVVSGFGHYIFNIKDTEASPLTMGKRLPEVHKKTAQELSIDYIETIENGYGHSGVHPGIIGELGTGMKIHEQEAKVLRAGAIAQQETGLPITLHMHPPVRNGHEALDILLETGATPDKIVLGHMDGVLTHPDLEFGEAVEHYLSLLERGCYIEFDLLGNQEYFITDEGEWWLPSDRERAKAIFKLCKHGYSDKILLSHDTGHKYYFIEYGGWGYAHALDGFRKTLLNTGLDMAVIEKFTLYNPMRMLTIG